MRHLRHLSRIAALSTAALALAAPVALGAEGAVELTPNRGGSSTIATPTTFKVTTSQLVTPYDTTGNTRVKAIRALLPEQLLYNTTDFPTCDIEKFLSTKICPAKTRIGSADILADGGPEVGPVAVRASLFYGDGFAILARVQSDVPAYIDEPIVGRLSSAQTKGYGLQMYIPVPPQISQPIDGIFPVVRSVTASVRPPSLKMKVRGMKRKVRVPLAGIGPCRGLMRFDVGVVYTDGLGLADLITEGAPTTARCRK